MTLDSRALFDGLKKDLEAYALQQFKDMSAAAISDGQAFITANRDEIQLWATELAAGKIDPDDLASNLRGLKSVAQLTALKQAGLAAVRWQNFCDGLIGVIVTSVEKLV